MYCELTTTYHVLTPIFSPPRHIPSSVSTTDSSAVPWFKRLPATDRPVRVSHSGSLVARVGFTVHRLTHRIRTVVTGPAWSVIGLDVLNHAAVKKVIIKNPS